TAPSRWTFRGKASARPTRIRGRCSRGRKPASTVTRASPTGYRRVPTTLAWHRTLRPRRPMRTSWNGDPRAYLAFRQGSAGAVLPERLIGRPFLRNAAAAALMEKEPVSQGRSRTHPSICGCQRFHFLRWALVNGAAQGGNQWLWYQRRFIARQRLRQLTKATCALPVAGRPGKLATHRSLYLRQVAIWAKSLVT